MALIAESMSWIAHELFHFRVLLIHENKKAAPGSITAILSHRYFLKVATRMIVPLSGGRFQNLPSIDDNLNPGGRVKV